MTDINCLVGREAMLVSTDINGMCIEVTIIGYCENKTLMVSIKDESIEISDRQLNSVYQLRAKYENIVYTFSTCINAVHYEPMTYLHLAFPDSGLQNGVRKSPRISLKKQKMTFSVNTGEDQVGASLADISLDGARLVARQRLAKVDETFCIDMLAGQGACMVTLPCKVRYVRTDVLRQGQGSIVFHHGVEFGALSADAEAFIASFIRPST